jgi:hypothetical protein
MVNKERANIEFSRIQLCVLLSVSVTAQIALSFAQEQSESAEFTGVNEHFPDGD